MSSPLVLVLDDVHLVHNSDQRLRRLLTYAHPYLAVRGWIGTDPDPGLADVIYGLVPVLAGHLLISGGYDVITMAGHEEGYTIMEYGEFFPGEAGRTQRERVNVMAGFPLIQS